MQLPILKPFELPVVEHDSAQNGSGQNGLDANGNAVATSCGSSGAAVFEPSRRLPPWLRREVPKGNANHFTWDTLRELNLETV